MHPCVGRDSPGLPRGTKITQPLLCMTDVRLHLRQVMRDETGWRALPRLKMGRSGCPWKIGTIPR